MKTSNACSQSGNVLWFILIAVALLGLLTMVLSRSGTTVDQSGNVEQTRIKAGEVLRYAKGLELALDQLRLNGCSENELSFENNTDPNYTNPNAPADESCHVFSTRGAGQTWREFYDQDLNNTSSATVFSSAFAIENVGTSRQELIVFMRVSPSVCAEINRSMDIDDTDPDDISTLGNFEDWNLYFTGDFSTLVYTIADGTDAAELDGKLAGCLIEPANENYVAFQTLIAR